MRRHDVRKPSPERDTLAGRRSVEKRSMWRRGLVRDNIGKCGVERASLGSLGLGMGKASLWMGKASLWMRKANLRTRKANLGTRKANLGRHGAGRRSLGWTCLGKPCRYSVLSSIVGLVVVRIVVDPPWNKYLKKEKNQNQIVENNILTIDKRLTNRHSLCSCPPGRPWSTFLFCKQDKDLAKIIFYI